MKLGNSLTSLIILFFAFVLFSCTTPSTGDSYKDDNSGNDVSENPPNLNEPYVNGVTGTGIFYAGGYLISQDKKYPGLVIDGESVILGSDEGSVNDIYVYKDTIYAVGYIYKNGVETPALWVNGNYKDELAGTGQATGVYVAGNSLYICGYIHEADTDIPCYWQNGTRKNLSTKGRALSIAVRQSDVFITGYGTIDNTNYPVIWHNEVEKILNYGSSIGATGGSCVDITIIDQTVCTGGYLSDDTGRSYPAYWIYHEDEYKLWYRTDYGKILTVAGNTEVLYGGGIENISGNDIATTWVANVYGKITKQSLNVQGQILDSVMHDNHLYMVGYTPSGLVNQPAYWLDGIMTLVPKYDGMLTTAFIKTDTQ